MSKTVINKTVINKTMTNDKVILISGASRGIGKAIAERLQQDGYRLSLGVRDSEVLKDCSITASETVLHYPFEATNKEPAKHWVANTLQQFGRIDGLINCAGLLRIHQLEDEDESALDDMWEVNVKGTLRLTRAALPALKTSGEGRIINVVSMSGKRVKGLSASYNITKYAQLALTHATRNIGWEHGIRTTALCPSWVNTEMAAQAKPMPPEAMTQAEDVADMVASVLALPNTAHVNELTINCSLEV